MTPPDDAFKPSSFWQPRKRTTTPLAAILWVLIAIGLLVLVWAISGAITRAHAHVPDHPEWDDVLAASRNANGGDCCGKGDAHLLEFDEWEATKTGYRVLIEGTWHDVEKWMLTNNESNPSGRAIVWYSRLEGAESGNSYNFIAVYCFKPLDTY